MRKIYMLLSFVIISLTFSGCNGLQKAQEKAQETTKNVKDLASGDFTGKLKAAVALGVPLKCTYEVDGIETTGYLKGKRYRGNMNYEGKSSTVIMVDNCLWVWEEGQAQGFTMCNEPDPETGKDIWDEMEDENPDVNYKCSPAVITDDMFTPPSEIEFLSFDNMLQGMEEAVKEEMNDISPEVGMEEVEDMMEQMQNINPEDFTGQ